MLTAGHMERLRHAHCSLSTHAEFGAVLLTTGFALGSFGEAALVPKSTDDVQPQLPWLTHELRALAQTAFGKHQPACVRGLILTLQSAVLASTSVERKA